MKSRLNLLAFAALSMLLTLPLTAAERNGYSLTVEVDDDARPEYRGNGNIYVEGLRGKAYVLRVTNPTGERVAVALSVDGLNTIDAKHTAAWTASKWVLEPYESTTIRGWQVSGSTARQFYFTGESRSYGAAIGQTQNLGVIQAVFYRERPQAPPYAWNEGSARDEKSAAPRRKGESSNSAPSAVESQAAVDDDYAATGMGRRTRNDVTRVAIDLERTAVASIAIRYEFRPQLVKLGVLREPRVLDRRERARGFDSWCPQPNVGRPVDGYSALDAARSALSLPVTGYTDAALAGIACKAVHFQELRDRTQ